MDFFVCFILVNVCTNKAGDSSCPDVFAESEWCTSPSNADFQNNCQLLCDKCKLYATKPNFSLQPGTCMVD